MLLQERLRSLLLPRLRNLLRAHEVEVAFLLLRGNSNIEQTLVISSCLQVFNRFCSFLEQDNAQVGSTGYKSACPELPR